MEPILGLRIDSLAFGGDGVGRADGKVCFVPYSAPGDLLSVRVVEERGSFLRAEILEVREPGTARREPRCGHFGRCGGCTWQHLDYAAQLEAKRAILEEAMSRIGGLTASVRPVIPSGQEYGYRTRARLHVVGSEIGYFARSSKRVVGVTECPILAPPLEARLRELDRQKATRLSSKNRRVDGTIEIELDDAEGVHERSGFPPDTTMRSDRRSRREQDGGDDYAFHQVNRFVNRELTNLVARTIAERAGSSPVEVVDLYCGNGNLSIPLAGSVSSIRGFDTSEESIRHAVQAARSAGLDVASYARMDAARALENIAVERTRGTVSPKETALCIIADPPRSGMKELTTAILKLHPELLIYVSCNPPTLARDSRRFVDGGMKLELLQPLDMFPQSFHLETVAVFRSSGR